MPGYKDTITLTAGQWAQGCPSGTTFLAFQNRGKLPIYILPGNATDPIPTSNPETGQDGAFEFYPREAKSFVLTDLFPDDPAVDRVYFWCSGFGKVAVRA